jgi:solute carrier family 25 iron transporter 28/37
MDAVKQKRQLNLKRYAGTFDCARRVVASEGIKALYAGYTTTLVMNIPYSFVYFATYDACRHYMKSDPSTYDLKAHLLSGAIAGAAAAALTNPLDVAKTRLQTQSDMGVYYSGMTDALKHIKQTEGWAGFSRGIVPRMIFFSMAAGIQWGSYEYVKHIFHADRYEPKETPTNH